MNKLPVLHQLTKSELDEIANNLVYTKHATKQIEKRLGINIATLTGKAELSDKVRQSDLAYVNTDSSINIAFSKHTYLVVGQDSLPVYVAITFKEPSHNRYTVQEKYELALKGVER